LTGQGSHIRLTAPVYKPDGFDDAAAPKKRRDLDALER
jgi:hypothetical protein